MARHWEHVLESECEVFGAPVRKVTEHKLARARQPVRRPIIRSFIIITIKIIINMSFGDDSSVPQTQACVYTRDQPISLLQSEIDKNIYIFLLF